MINDELYNCRKNSNFLQTKIVEPLVLASAEVELQDAIHELETFETNVFDYNNLFEGLPEYSTEEINNILAE